MRKHRINFTYRLGRRNTDKWVIKADLIRLSLHGFTTKKLERNYDD